LCCVRAYSVGDFNAAPWQREQDRIVAAAVTLQHYGELATGFKAVREASEGTGAGGHDDSALLEIRL